MRHHTKVLGGHISTMISAILRYSSVRIDTTDLQKLHTRQLQSFRMLPLLIQSNWEGLSFAKKYKEMHESKIKRLGPNGSVLLVLTWIRHFLHISAKSSWLCSVARNGSRYPIKLKHKQPKDQRQSHGFRVNFFVSPFSFWIRCCYSCYHF